MAAKTGKTGKNDKKKSLRQRLDKDGDGMIIDDIMARMG